MKHRPNLIYIFADQLRADSLRSSGNRYARTPNINRFVLQSVDFSNAVSSTPVCAPYRASLFTGKYSSGTGMVINELRMNSGHHCFGHVLTEGGYETAYIGKWHLYADNSNHSDMRNHWVPPGPDRLGFDGYWAAYNFWHRYNEAFYFTDSADRIDVDGYEPDVQTDLAIAQIEHLAGGQKPFALFLSYGTVHDPWTRDNVPEEYYSLYRDTEFSLPESWSDTPDPYMDRFTDPQKWLETVKPEIPDNLRVYFAMLANLDSNFGRLLRAVGEAGIEDETIVVFTSDHGEMFGAHGRIQKLTFYDEAARVPFFVRIPAGGGGRKSDVCLGTPDIMPTLLSALGLPIPAEVEGSDLSFVLNGALGTEPEAAFLQGMGHTYQWNDGFEWRALRDKRYTYAVYRVDGKECLFDNLADPRQQRNLIDDDGDRLIQEKYRDMVARKMADLGDTFEACTWYGENWIKDRRIVRAAKPFRR